MARLRKINGRYYSYFYDRNRQPVEKSVPLKVTLKSAAEKLKNRLENEYAEGTFDPWSDAPRLKPLTLKEAEEHFLEDHPHHRPNTAKAYRTALRGLRGHTAPGVMLTAVRAKDVRAYVMDQSVQQGTRAKRYRHLLAFFNWAEEKGHVHDNPLQTVRKPKAPKTVPDYLTTAQFKLLSRTMEADAKDGKERPGRTPRVQWLKDLVTMAVTTGLRLGALGSLRWNDVDLEGGRLTVRNREREGRRTKSGDEQSIPIAPDARSVLERLHEERAPNSDPFVLHTATGLPLNTESRQQGASRRFKHYVRLAGLPEYIKFHSLRDTCASWLAANGTPSVTIKNILGHSALTVTDRYMHNAPDHMDDAMNETFSRLGGE